jgi:hypothetical protein
MTKVAAEQIQQSVTNRDHWHLVAAFCRIGVPIADKACRAAYGKAKRVVRIISFRQRPDDAPKCWGSLEMNLQHIPWTLESIFQLKVGLVANNLETNQQVLPYNNTHWYRYYPSLRRLWGPTEGVSKHHQCASRHQTWWGKWDMINLWQKIKRRWTRGKAPSPIYVIIQWWIV